MTLHWSEQDRNKLVSSAAPASSINTLSHWSAGWRGARLKQRLGCKHADQKRNVVPVEIKWIFLMFNDRSADVLRASRKSSPRSQHCSQSHGQIYCAHKPDTNHLVAVRLRPNWSDLTHIGTDGRHTPRHGILPSSAVFGQRRVKRVTSPSSRWPAAQAVPSTASHTASGQWH